MIGLRATRYMTTDFLVPSSDLDRATNDIKAELVREFEDCLDECLKLEVDSGKHGVTIEGSVEVGEKDEIFRWAPMPNVTSVIIRALDIEDVIFNEPATIVFWNDETKTVVKCQDNDTYDKEKGLAMCIAKKVYDNKSAYNDVFKKWIPEIEEVEE